MKARQKSENQSYTILMVEDSPTQALKLRQILEEEGFRTAVFSNGKEALSYLKDRKPTIIISDIVMPEMDGFELCSTIKKDEDLKDIPIILLTALTSPEDVIKGLQSGADNFITKPYEKEFLLSRIQYILVNQEVRKKGATEVGLNIYFMGQTHTITSNRMQIVDLLLSTYEHAVIQNQELIRTKAKLEKLNEQLEEKVKQRTQRIEHLNNVIRAIRNVNQLITKEKDQDLLIKGACENLVKTRGFNSAWIALTDDSGRLIRTADAGLGEAFRKIKEDLEKGILPVCARNALAQSGSLLIEDPLTECGKCPLASSYKGNSRVSVRLECGGKIYGILSTSILKDFFWDKEERGLFEELGEDIGFALYNMERDEERKKADQAVKESEEKYRALFEDSKDAIYIVLREGMFVDVNQAMLDLFGYTRDEMIGMSILNIYNKHDDRSVMLNELGKKGSLKDYPVKFKSRDGTEMDCLLTETVKREDDRIIGYQGIVRDITSQKKLESQLRQAQKMEAIGTLAGGIAHDFNNILGAIIGYTEIADLQVHKNSKAKESLKEVLKAGRRARDLVKQILAFSRKGEQERIPIQIGPIVKEALKLLRSSLPATIEIRQNIKSDTGIVEADPTQIHQILMNLCANASHAMREEGGILEVGTRNVEVGSWDSESGYLDIPPGNYLRLTVSDTGQGMTPEVLERIFEPYYTTKEKGEGTGLGLSVVHGIVKNYGGTITAYSEPGKGTTFHVYLPVIQEKAEVPDIAEFAPIPTGNEHILFIDDELALVEIGKQMLERLGYKVTSRASSTEALELFKAKPNQFDLVITDMTMPYMTGERLAGELMNIRSDIPVIICTGYSDRISEEKAKGMGIRAFVMKPLVIRGLAKTVREVLDPVISKRER
jgi:PAS domain S-box-containing protein